MADQIEVAQTAQTDSQALQNDQMMYEFLMVSITDEAKSALASSDLDFSEDGQKLFFLIVNQLLTATFSNAQATRDQRSDFTNEQLCILGNQNAEGSFNCWRHNHRSGNPVFPIQDLQKD